MIKTQEYAKLSMEAYAGTAPTGWEMLDVALPEGSQEDGFWAGAYRNLANQSEIVVAFRGTDTVADAAANKQLVDSAVGGVGEHRQFLDAIEFAHAVQLAYSGIGVAISVTGHSLGGALAQLVADVFGWGGETFDAPGALALTMGDNLAQFEPLFAKYGLSFGHVNEIGVLTNHTVNGSLISEIGQHIGGEQPLAIPADPPGIILLSSRLNIPLAVSEIVILGAKDQLERHSIANIYQYLQSQTEAGRVLQEYIGEYLAHGVDGYDAPERGLAGDVGEFFSDIFKGEAELSQADAEALIADLDDLRETYLFNDPGNTAALDDLLKAQDQIRIATQDIVGVYRDNPDWREGGENASRLTFTIELEHVIETTGQWIRLDFAVPERSDGSPVDFVVTGANVEEVPLSDPPLDGPHLVDHYRAYVEPGSTSATVTLVARRDDNETPGDRLALGDVQFSLPGRSGNGTVWSETLSIAEDPAEAGLRPQLPVLPGTSGDDHDDGEEDNSLYGSGGADLIDGMAGHDAIYGFAGDDWLYGGSGRDVIDGGSGSDVIWAAPGGGADADNAVQAGYGDDWLFGGSGSDVLAGGAGRDVLFGGAGDDHIRGAATMRTVSPEWYVTSAPDVLYAHFSGDIYGTDGSGDVAFGGDGADLMVAGPGDDWYSGDAGADSLSGNAGDDRLLGGPGADVLQGGFGHDVLEGGADSDWLLGDHFNTTSGAPGNDYLDGGDGSDHLFGEGGADRLLGGDGDDELDGDQYGLDPTEHGDDALEGGSGHDLLVGNGGSDYLHGGDGDDQLYGDGADLPAAYHGSDRLIGGPGDDTLVGSGEADVLYGGVGADYLDGDNEGLDGAAHGDDELYGGSGPDTLYGSGGGDVLSGGDDNDAMYGDDSSVEGQYHGADWLDGGHGDDTLLGYGGDDVLLGGVGHDTIWGDAFDLDAAHHGDDWIDGGGGNDSLRGNGGQDLLWGGPGNDYLRGDGDDDALFGEEGEDSLWGGAGNDYLDGGDMADRLFGDAGNDSLFGGGGDDEVIGSNGDDALYGGPGSDRLVGDAGNDRLDGGGHGTDRLYGGYGDDTYLIGLGDGTSYVYENWGADEIRFGAGIQPEDIRVAYSRDSLSLIHQGGQNVVLIPDWFAEVDERYRVESIVFEDGTVWSGEDLHAAALHRIGSDEADLFVGSDTFGEVFEGRGGDDQLVGRGGDDVLLGGAGTDYLSGGAGSDYLESGPGGGTLRGGPGQDVYRVELPDEPLTIVDEWSEQATDVLYLGDGFSKDPADLFSDGVDLYWIVDEYAHVQVESHFDGGDIARFVFSDNSEWTPADIEAFDVRPTADSLAGGPGDDVFHVDSVLDRITEPADAGYDVVHAAVSYALPANVEEGVLTGSLDFELRGNELDNRLVGNSGDNVLDGLGGEDVMLGGSGDDTYLVDDRDDRVLEEPGGGWDTIVCDPDYFYTFYFDVPDEVEEVQFVGQHRTEITGNALDNVIMVDNGVLNNVIDGGPGADIMGAEESSGATYYVDDPGDQILDTSEYSDVVSSVSFSLNPYFENLTLLDGADQGQGNDRSNTLISDSFDPQVLIGKGGNDYYEIQSDDVIVEESGGGYDQVYIHDARSGKHVIVGAAHVEVFRISQYMWADIVGNPSDNIIMGSERQNRLEGGDGDDELNGQGGDDILRGGRGADHLQGGQGGDRYEFSPGDGHDVILENGDLAMPADEFDVLALAADVDPASLTIRRSTDSLEVGYGESGDAVSVEYWYAAHPVDRRLESLEFGYGTGGTFFLGDLQVGGPDADVLQGTGLGEVLAGGAGADELIAGEGNDLLVGDAGDDVGTGGVGDDWVFGGGGNDTLHGGVGNDWLDAGAGTGWEYLYGGEGDDLLRGGSGYNALYGGIGNDVLYAGEDGAYNVLVGDEWSAALGGEDVLYGSSTTDYLFGGTGRDELYGSGGADTLVGGAGDDTLDGGTGNDYLLGQEGDDLVFGGAGADQLFGDGGNDTLRGGEGDDELQAGTGDAWQYLYGDGGDDVLVGGAQGYNALYGGSGNDTLTAQDGAGWNLLIGDDWLADAAGGDDTLTGASGMDYLFGGGGRDHLEGGAGGDTLVGGPGDDALSGGEGADYLAGSDDHDTLEGGGGDDQLLGDAGNDLLYGGAGNDRLWAGTGSDSLFGGVGDDELVGGSATEGSWTYDVLRGEDGNDVIAAGSKWAAAFGGEGDDVLRGGEGFSYLAGEQGHDFLAAGDGGSSLVGGGGDDVLVGGTGGDTLAGGVGDDTYRYQRGFGAVRILDFEDTSSPGYVPGNDRLEFGPEIAREQLWFDRSGDDLRIALLGTAGGVEIQDWYLGDEYRVESFVTAAGDTLAAAHVDQLVSAMAAFDPPAPGELTLPPDLEAELQPVIAGAWQAA